MVKVFCDMCGREIDYEVDGVRETFFPKEVVG